MDKEIIVVDNFYEDPDFVRRFALLQKFDVTGNYPGVRTKPLLNPIVKSRIEGIVGKQVSHWFDDYCGCFQAVDKTANTWIHADKFNDWAGVCYLTPDPEPRTGTGFFRLGDIRHGEVDKDDPSPIDPNWVETDYVDNVYNRLVLYKGNLFHKAMGYFGEPDIIPSQRLFQVFFFNT